MNKNPKVSLLIPVYNGEKFIRDSIESALMQTYNNLEIIVINDGSTDNTDLIVKEYKDKIKYIKKENGGVSTALNIGIKNMTGEYFSWLSHDDFYYPTKIEEEVKYILELNNEKAIIYSDFQIMNEFGNIIQNVEFDNALVSKFYLLPLLKSSLNGISLLIPKKAFEESGLFDENLICTQDYAKWGDMISKGYKFYHLNKTLVITRTHPNQTTHTSPAMLKEGNELWKYIDSKIPENTKIELFRNNYNYYRIFENLLKDSPYIFACNEMKQMKLKYEKKSKKPSVSIIIIGEYDKENYKKTINSINEKDIDLEIISTIKMDTLNFYSENIDKCIENCKKEYVSFLRIGDELENNNLYIRLSEMEKSHSIISMCSSNIFNCLDGYVLSEVIYLPHFESSIMLNKEYVIKNSIKFNSDFRFGILNCLKETDLLGISNTKIYAKKTLYIQDENICFLKNIISDKELSKSKQSIFNLCNLINNTNNNCNAEISNSIIKKVFLIFRKYGFKEVISRIKKRILK